MAAQEYYNPGSTSQTRPPPPPSTLQPHPQQGPRPSSQGPPAPSNPPYPMSDAPPPYQAYSEQQRPQSQPPMQRIPNQNGGPQYQPYNPNQNGDTHYYPPEKVAQRPSTLQNMYRPSDYTSSHPPPQQYQAQPPPPPPLQQQTNGYAPSASGYFAPAGPGLSQIGRTQQLRPPRRSSTSGYPTAQSPYRRDSRSRSRSRSRDRDRKHRHNHNRPGADRKKSSGTSAFLGAGGGALIGDLIFPGLGTIGGAILGGVGGHEYSKKRPSSTPSRVHNRKSGGNGNGEYYEDERRGRKY
ncbi:uncharacterized protein LTR77_007640 [Saxophila tyrrhenica]|uniref:Uncharacterized protein n=1 Tax=Saxophila tyrrhenica TaxID=1690608 RepID=A0AAV9P3F2_9PEZI|nr:hypothetical protein LTR77_007640 [Saxophila tyrrhenica]